MVMSINSGDGERAAMLGYVSQYIIAANLIYEALLDGSLEWFRVADPDAGSLDDILIATTGKLDAYQVKWAEFTKPISYADFVRDGVTKTGNEKRSLFRQLTDAWVNQKEKYKERTVKVHLIHKLVSSSNSKAKIPVGETQPQHPHFQAFLKDCWLDRSWCESGFDEAAACWKETLLDLKSKSGFTDDDFLKFIPCCELEFNYKLPSDIPVTNQGQARKKEDIEKIYNLLTQMAGGEHRIVEIFKDDMLKKLGWSHRFKHKFVHEFPIDQTYQEIEETVNSISDALSQKKQGYIALLGSPGSGKSTTLTHTLKYNAGYKLVRYYAYVPDSTHQGRGESTMFLHDITISLKKYGFPGDNHRQPGSREEYLSLLGEQLKQAHEKWKNDDVITIVMVDGLDHIQREQNPQQSLLSDLPLPNTIPDGVIFFLGSQTLELKNLSDAIKEHVNEKGRTIDISPLTRSNVYAAINKWPGCSELTDNNKREIFEKSSGHPLYLIYLLQFIIDNSETHFDKVINNFPSYKEHIEESYSIYWRQIEGNQSLVNFLALLSRLRIPINTHVLTEWADNSTIRQFLSSASHYFKKNSDESWRFFHNSFRQFVLDKTSRDLFGNIVESKNIGYHKKLADYCLQSIDHNPMRWETIYHLFKAKKIEAVIETGTQSYFREQFFNYRNISDITDDINAVLLSAKELNNPLAIVRCFLIESELKERKDALNQIDVLNLLFSSKGSSSALDYMFDGELLQVSGSEALIFSKVLAKNELFNEAKRVFDSAEPLGYLSGGDSVNPHHGGTEDLKRWADVAHYFVPLADIISAIFQTKYEDDGKKNWHRDDENLHTHLMRRLINGVCETKEGEKIEELFSFLSSKEKYVDHFLYLCKSVCINQFPTALTAPAFHVVVSSETEGDDLESSNRLLVAELDYRINGSLEKNKNWLKDVEQPKLYKHGLHGRWKNLSLVADRIRLNRLLAALGEGIDPVKIVPNERDQKLKGSVLFERGLVRFSSIWGKGWAGEKLLPSFIVQEIKPSFELFRKPYGQTSDWIGWYNIDAAAVDYFKFAIKATSEHGHDCVLALATAFREDWQKRYWPVSWRREIAFALYEEEDDRDALVNVLNEIEKKISDFDDVHSKISEYCELSIIWSKIDEADRAAALVPKVFMGSFSIYHHKDDQFSHWVSWLGKLVDQYPDLAYDEICRFSSALVNLEQSNNGQSTQEVGRDLIAIATRWDDKYGLQLLKWLFDQKGLHYNLGLTGLLSGMLDRPDPSFKEISTIMEKLLIPFEEYNSSKLSKQFASLCCMSSADGAEEQIEKIVTSIRTHLLPSNRCLWLEGIALGMREAGLNNSQYASMAISTPQVKHVTHDPSLKLKSGEKLTDEEALLKACSVESLFQLIRSVESVDYFRWMSLVQPFLKEMNVSQLDELHKLLQPFDHDSNVVSSIAIALSKKGEIDKANCFLKDLLNNLDATSWDLHWSGGAKLSIFKALVEIDSKQWRPKAISCLVDDYISEYRYPRNLIGNLDEIFDILFEDVDVLPIWKEIKDHVYQLDNFEESGEKPPTLLDGTEVPSDADLLIQFTFDMFDVGIPELAYMAHQAIVDFARIEKNWPAIHREVANRVDKVGLTQIKIMSLLASLVDDCKDFVVQFKTNISSLCASEDFSVRMVALDLSNKLGIEGELPPAGRSKLPLVYELELPKIENKEEAIPFSAIQAGNTFPDVNDPIELLRPFLDVAELVAGRSNIPVENVVHRASDLMKTLVPETEWNKKAEEVYRKRMEGVGLKLTYNRLRPKVAKLALSHVVCELLDAGRIPSQEFDLFSVIFKRSDEFLLALEPDIRPECIVIPQAIDREIYHNHDEWLQNIELAVSQFANSIETEKEIIGELTTWVWLDWKMPTEIRMSTICHPEWNSETDMKSPAAFFPNKRHWSASDYPDISFINEDSFVIYGSDSYICHGCLEWLALNPVIGFPLGWSLSPEGLFRWIDEKGEIMVESIYWKDGPISRQPPKTNDICSNGWLVVASHSAVEQIREVIGKAVKLNVVVRRFGKDAYEPATVSTQQRVNWYGESPGFIGG